MFARIFRYFTPASLILLAAGTAIAAGPESRSGKEHHTGKATSEIRLGFLEEFASATPKEDDIRPALVPQVRMAFYRASNTWAPYPSRPDESQNLRGLMERFPSPMHWTICRNGKAAGSIDSRNPESYKYVSWAGMQRVDEKQAMPFFSGDRDDLFAGWIGMPVHHPSVVVSGESCLDPENWQDNALTFPWDRAQFAAALKEKPGLRDAQDERGGSGPFDPVSNPEKARWALMKSYQAKDKRRILSFRMQEERDQFSDETFLVAADGSIRHLGSNLIFIAAGDFDGGGKSELLFYKASYNEDGYVLFPGEGGDPVTFLWSYH